MIYYNQGEQEGARVRKGIGTEDVSGDYVNYPEIKTENVNGKSVTMKGKEEKVVLAIWNDGEYSYAVSVEKSISVDEMTELVSVVE